MEREIDPKLYNTLLRIFQLCGFAMTNLHKKWIYSNICFQSHYCINCEHQLVVFIPSLPAMDWNGSILTKLLFCFVDLANEVNKSFSRLRHSLLWPVSELELPYSSRLAILWRESHIPSHIGGCHRDSPSAQRTKATICKFFQR